MNTAKLHYPTYLLRLPKVSKSKIMFKMAVE